ncbi:Helicase C-terminal domain family protein [Babesia bovis T2Bo]|uniref:DNA repair helicase (Rad3) family protein n=1 Tax=Babesia bovis TaxID=5865 RepID=A7APF5_BABBO|nr:Helicase C-terminal domain family protein [Babesia bovis T2Bo]EDO08439.1 Helicase C-terminal domain family protein [Babesia bovis T2Bo]|eukprot:XP_001612007.1 DNA repair helicase (rad3) family protein [Babesia bovis T2Bo]
MAANLETVQIIDGIEVRFPYTPYENQTVYMETVIKAVRHGKNALLESPTGTGKTLSLICSTLACIWHTRFKDETSFNLKPVQTTSEEGLMKTMQDLRDSIQQKKTIVKFKGSKKLRILYASRTHNQLKQVIREAKKTSYAKEFASKGLTTVLLGSRDQLCIHPGKKNATGEALNAFCRKMVKHQGCMYYRGLKKKEISRKIQFYEFVDIEDLISLGKSTRCCPFYACRDAHESADVTMLPYNYLLSPISRDAMDIVLDNAVLIIDEAHNIESVAESSAGFTIRQVDIARFLMVLRRFCEYHIKAIEYQASNNTQEVAPIDLSALARLSVSLKGVDRFLTNVQFENHGKDGEQGNNNVAYSWRVGDINRAHAVFRGVDILQYFLLTLGFNELRACNIEDTIRSCISAISVDIDDFSLAHQSSYESTKVIQEDAQIMNMLLEFLQHIFSKEFFACPEYFHVFVTHDRRFADIDNSNTGGADRAASQPSGGGWKNKAAFRQSSTSSNNSTETNAPFPKVMAFECMQSTPSFLGLQNAGVRSVILTSGTLSPLADLANSIGGDKVRFEYQLSSSHIVPVSNLCPRVITGGDVDGSILSSDYNNRSTPSYIKALGESVLTFVRCVPAGVLVFFVSYPVLEDTVNAWKSAGIFAALEKEKRVFIESKGSAKSFVGNYYNRNTNVDDTQSQLKEYFTLTDKGVGCLFLGVCRGKLAEGIDFSDDSCRGVFLCGVPYPNPYEETIALKMDYLRKLYGKNNENVTHWFTSQAIRAVNQAIGRVIRHINDYGAIVLADRRFSAEHILKSVSSWVTRNIMISDNMNASKIDILDFFEKMSTPAISGKRVKTRAGYSTSHPSFGYNNRTMALPLTPPRDVSGTPLVFKSRKISTTSTNLRSTMMVDSNSTGVTRSNNTPDDSATESQQRTAPSPVGWDVMDSWHTTDTISLSTIKKSKKG